MWLALLQAVPAILSGAIVCALEQQYESVLGVMRARSSDSASGAFSNRAKLIRLQSMLQSGCEAGHVSLLAVFIGSMCAVGTGPTRAGQASASAHDLPDHPQTATNSAKSSNLRKHCSSDPDSYRGALGCPLLSSAERENYGAAGAAAPRRNGREASTGQSRLRNADTIHPKCERSRHSAFVGVQPAAADNSRNRARPDSKASAPPDLGIKK